MKGMSKDQAESIADKLSSNPEIVDAMKSLEENKEVKALFEKIQKEIEEKKKSGLGDEYVTILVMNKYKAEMLKHRQELEPLMRLMM